MWFDILKKDFSDAPEVIKILERMGFTVEETNRGIEFHNEVVKGRIMWRDNKEDVKNMLRSHSIPPEYNWSHDQIRRHLIWELDKLSRAKDRVGDESDEAWNSQRRKRIQNDLRTLNASLSFRIKLEFIRERNMPGAFSWGGNNIFKMLNETKEHLNKHAEKILDDKFSFTNQEEKDKHIKWAKEMLGE